MSLDKGKGTERRSTVGVGVGVLGGVEHPGTMTDTQSDRQTQGRGVIYLPGD